MDVSNKRLFRVLACCELMQTDHTYTLRTKSGFVRRFIKGDRLRFITLTVPEDSLPLYEVSARFRRFANSRWWRKLTRCRSYVCVYEPHPSGHGWHIHILCNFFLPWQQLDVVARAYLFGHTDVEAADSTCAFYIAKYVTKSQVLRRAQDSRHVRIVNVSRDLIPLRDVVCNSPSADYIRENWDSVGGKVWERLRFLYYHWVYTFSGVFLPHRRDYDSMLDDLRKKQGGVRVQSALSPNDWGWQFGI